MKTLIQKYIGTLVFIATLFTITKIGKQPKCPSMIKLVKKLWYIYAMEYYSVIKRVNSYQFSTTWMDLKGIMLSEKSRTEKENYCMISLSLLLSLFFSFLAIYHGMQELSSLNKDETSPSAVEVQSFNH